MGKYIARRLLLLIPTILGIILLTFVIFKLTPGDPAQMILKNTAATPEQVAALRQQLGLNDPLYVQFARYVWQLMRGDLGKSYYGGFPVLASILARFPATIELTFAAMIFVIFFGISTGILSSTARSKALKDTVMFFSLWGMAVPQYWLAAVFIIIFAVQLKLIPVFGGTGVKNLILPAIALSLAPASSLTRLTHSSIRTIMGNDFVRTARAKGLPELTVIIRHVLPNALIPVVTMLGLQFGSMLGGAVFIEAAFGRAGLGTFAIAAITNRDYPQIQGVVVLGALAFVLVNLFVDLIYGVLDPRIRYD
jgi:peptide/nickel transport system permease protein